MDVITKPLYTYVTFTKPYCAQQIHYTCAHPLHYLDKLTKGFHTHLARQALSGRGEIKSMTPLSGSFLSLCLLRARVQGYHRLSLSSHSPSTFLEAERWFGLTDYYDHCMLADLQWQASVERS